DALTEHGYRIDDVLAAIENDQNSLIGKKGAQIRFWSKARYRTVENRGDGSGDVIGVCQTAQIDETNGIDAKLMNHALGDRNGDACLSNSARTDDADKSSRQEQPGKQFNGIQSTDQGAQQCRKRRRPRLNSCNG